MRASPWTATVPPASTRRRPPPGRTSRRRPTEGRRVDLDTLTRDDIAQWRAGDTLLLNGRMLTGRDAAHRRIQDLLARGEPMPVDFAGRVIYYVGPVDPVRNEAVGPTTSTRMDGYGDDAGARRPAGDGGQGRARTRGGRGDSAPSRRLPDRRRRRRLSGVAGHPRRARGGVRGPGHGSHLRVRRGRHARHRGGGRAGRQRARGRPARWRRAPAGAIGGIAIRGA